MLREKFIRKKIELIHKDLGRLQPFAQMTFDEVAKDWMRYNAVERLLEKIIGRGIDINQHIISELVSIQVAAPLEYRETFLKLAELKVLPEDFAKEISESAGFRNVLVHEYNEVDEHTVYRSVGGAIGQYSRYCDYILKFLQNQPEK